MAMLLAPYNDAMRLGMGFNSFTQQLCINDSVRLEGGQGQPASEKNLRPQYKFGQMSGADGGNVDISQDVTWTAKFVDRISEITDSLNVGGSLQIKCDAIGGGGSASASFIDTNKFKESDINYFIQVRVTNQRLTAPDLTDFDPIPNLPASEFNRVYGDSFISGFTEGGEFNALISIKLKDRSKAKEIKGELEVGLNFSAVSVSGKGKVEKTDGSRDMQGETTIAVSWKGGGDIKDATVTDWTLETLKIVAMEFPEHVMACPMRTNAILTKYTGLKSFYQKGIKGSPLEYDNAGVYSSALLDAYMDYKIMWRNIQQSAWEVEQKQSALFPKDSNDELAQMGLEAKTYFERQMEKYKEKKARLEQLGMRDQSAAFPVNNSQGALQPANSEENEQALVTTTSQPICVAPPVPAPAAAVPYSPPALVELESQEPLPPNDFVPYTASLFGLDKARRDCRFEMIKIVREVDAVADDPRVACDPTRAYQFLSPAVFRMLLPTVRNFDKARAEAALEETKRIQAQADQAGRGDQKGSEKYQQGRQAVDSGSHRRMDSRVGNTRMGGSRNQNQTSDVRRRQQGPSDEPCEQDQPSDVRRRPQGFSNGQCEQDQSSDVQCRQQGSSDGQFEQDQSSECEQGLPSDEQCKEEQSSDDQYRQEPPSDVQRGDEDVQCDDEGIHNEPCEQDEALDEECNNRDSANFQCREDRPSDKNYKNEDSTDSRCDQELPPSDENCKNDESNDSRRNWESPCSGEPCEEEQASKSQCETGGHAATGGNEWQDSQQNDRSDAQSAVIEDCNRGPVDASNVNPANGNGAGVDNGSADAQNRGVYADKGSQQRFPDCVAPPHSEQEFEELKQELAGANEKLQEAERITDQTRRAVAPLETLRQQLSPWNGWCPVPVRSHVRFRNVQTRKCMDFFWSDGRGGMDLFQHEINTDSNQRFEICPVGPRAFSIRHIASGKFVTTANQVSYGVYFTMGGFPTFFTFEAMLQDGNYTGMCMVHIAEMPEHTLNVEGGGTNDGAKIIGYTGDKTDNDKWYIKDFDDMSI